MARGQDAAGRGGLGGELTAERVAVLVHDRLEAEAALALAAEAGLEVELVMPVGLAGPAFAKALEELLGHPITAWCDDRPGLALEALRVGLRDLVLEDAATAPRLADIAGQQGAGLRTALPTPLYRSSPDGCGLLRAALGLVGRPVP